MRELSKAQQNRALNWLPGMGIRERAQSLGWLGPFTPDEWAFLSQGCDDAKLYRSARWQSPEVEQITKAWADTLDAHDARVEMAEIRYRNAVDAEVTRARDVQAVRVQNGAQPLQVGEAMMVNMPDNGPAARALAALQDTISDRADAIAERDRAVLAQFAAESVAPVPDPPTPRGVVLMSRGRRA